MFCWDIKKLSYSFTDEEEEEVEEEEDEEKRTFSHGTRKFTEIYMSKITLKNYSREHLSKQNNYDELINYKWVTRHAMIGYLAYFITRYNVMLTSYLDLVCHFWRLWVVSITKKKAKSICIEV